MRSSTKSRIQFALWIVVVILAGLNRARGIDPTWVVWLGIGLMLLAQLGLWLLTRMRYVDYVLVPLRPEQLPHDIRQKFDRRSPVFMNLGCTLVGDFQLSFVPWPTYVRYFLPRDRRILGEVSQTDETSATSFITVFGDGRMIETACLDPTGSPTENRAPVAVSPDAYGAMHVDTLVASLVSNYFDRAAANIAPPKESPLQCREDRMLWAQDMPGLSVEQLLALHVRIIDLYESTYGAKAIDVTPDRLLDFAQYGHRLLWFQQGDLPARYGTPKPPGPLSQWSSSGKGMLPQRDMLAPTAAAFQAEPSSSLFRAT